jgi:hypothetical protein
MKRPQAPFTPDDDLVRIMAGSGGPCTYLLVSLLGLILLFPYLQEGFVGRTSLGILFSLVLLASSFVATQTRRTFAFKLGLALIGVALQWVALWSANRTALGLAALAFTASLVVAIGGVLRYVLKHGPITADKLHGALSGYIMLAMLFALIYAVIELTHVGSFGPQRLDFAHPGDFFELIFFSLTTLTTTGYGDIVPITNQARSVVMIEEFAGVFYVGVLIARLAGLYPQSRQE